jgi:hypothetical protein
LRAVEVEKLLQNPWEIVITYVLFIDTHEADGAGKDDGR